MDKLSDVFSDLYTNDLIDENNLNAIWVEIDKGLLSDNLGQQCEAIAKFTELFDRVPLPVFVNSGFLKLAKVFQNGNNYIKLHVIRVIEKNHKHLEKIVSIDELLKPFLHNIHSNDSTCRALTLRALAEICTIISEKQNVHHHIRVALESHDYIETKEAIYAANKFCSISKLFADSVCDHISKMIEDITTPLDIKLKLIPILVNMHHDTHISLKAKNVCESMYNRFPFTTIRKLIINTMTKIACKSLTNVHETLDFFIDILRNELRESLCVILLDNFKLLAIYAPQLWTKDHIRDICLYLNDLQNEVLTVKATEVLCLLANKLNTSLCTEFSSKSNLLIPIIQSNLFHQNIQISFHFCTLSTKLLLFVLKNSKNDLNLIQNEYRDIFNDAKDSIFALILNLEKEKSSNNLRSALKCMIDLSEIKIEGYSDEIFAFLLHLLESLESNSSFYCDALITLGTRNLNGLKANEAVLYALFDKAFNQGKDQDLQYKLLSLILEANIVDVHQNVENDLLTNSINKFLSKSNYWFNYKLTRLCIRYTFYNYATIILEKNLLQSTGRNFFKNQNFKIYLNFLLSICNAELCLTKNDFKNFNEFLKNLNKSLSYYTQSQFQLKSLKPTNATSTSTSMYIQLKYCELRIEQIKLFIHLIMATMTFQTVPPPIFLYSTDNLNKYGRIATQIKYTVTELQKLILKYKVFIKEFFDADLNTINILNICKRNNELFCNILMGTFKSEPLINDDIACDVKSTQKIEVQLNNTFCSEIHRKFRVLSSYDKESSIYEYVKVLQEIITDFIQYNLPLPRAFFQSLQKTQIKLIINPNSKTTNNLIQLRHDQTLVLKIDGIIKQQFKMKPIRTISKIQVNLITELDQKTSHDKVFGKYSNIQSCIEEPRNDYFNCQLLVNFPFFGVTYILQIEVQIIDNNGVSWMYNAGKHVLYVKIDEDGLNRKIPKQMPSMPQIPPLSHTVHIEGDVHEAMEVQ